MKTSKTKSAKHRSLKGKRGNQVGAPPKAFRINSTPFTMASAFNTNKNQCHLSVRKKIDALLAAGSIIQLASRKQAKGGVGRPMAVFIKAENYDATKHVKLGRTAPAKTAHTVAVPTDAPVTEPTPTPETAHITETPAPAAETAKIAEPALA